MFGSLNMYLGAAAGAALMFGLALSYDTLIDDPAVRRQERTLYEAEVRERAMALIEQRNKDNAEITDLDAAGLCIELGGKWVSDEGRCD